MRDPVIIVCFQAVKKVRAALRGKADGRINDVPFMVSFTHTGLIGRYNCPKCWVSLGECF